MSAELVVDASAIAGSAADPAPVVAALRERDPVCWLPGLDAWLVTRHEDVRRLFADPRLTADPRVHASWRPPADPASMRWLSEMPFRYRAEDGGESLGRRLVSAALTPRAVARLEACVEEVVRRFAAPLAGRTGCVDLMEEFTVPVSATAIGRILGVPPKDEDEAYFGRLARKATRAIRPFLSDKSRRATEQACVEMCDYVLDLARQRRAAPAEDLISELLHSSGGAEEDVTRVVAGLVSAGTGTTSVACARALRGLLQFPDQLELLRRDRGLLPNAVNELLRFDSGLLVMPRYVISPLEVRRRAFEPGQIALLSLMGANRDPRVFDDPDRVDLRRDTSQALSFGHGAHYCVGANIARLEMRRMLDAALDFLPPDARVREHEIDWSERGLMSQIRSLPVDFG